MLWLEEEEEEKDEEKEKEEEKEEEKKERSALVGIDRNILRK